MAAKEAADAAAAAAEAEAAASALQQAAERESEAKSKALRRGKSSRANADGPHGEGGGGGSGFGSLVGTPKPGMDEVEAKKLGERAEKAEADAFRLRQEVRTTRAHANRDRLLLRHMLVSLSGAAEAASERASAAEAALAQSREQLERLAAENERLANASPPPPEPRQPTSAELRAREAAQRQLSGTPPSGSYAGDSDAGSIVGFERVAGGRRGQSEAGAPPGASTPLVAPRVAPRVSALVARAGGLNSRTSSAGRGKYPQAPLEYRAALERAEAAEEEEEERRERTDDDEEGEEAAAAAAAAAGRYAHVEVAEYDESEPVGGWPAGIPSPPSTPGEGSGRGGGGAGLRSAKRRRRRRGREGRAARGTVQGRQGSKRLLSPHKAQRQQPQAAGEAAEGEEEDGVHSSARALARRLAGSGGGAGALHDEKRG